MRYQNVISNGRWLDAPSRISIFKSCGHYHRSIQAALRCRDTLLRENPVEWSKGIIIDEDNYPVNPWEQG